MKPGYWDYNPALSCVRASCLEAAWERQFWWKRDVSQFAVLIFGPKLQMRAQLAHEPRAGASGGDCFSHIAE